MRWGPDLTVVSTPARHSSRRSPSGPSRTSPQPSRDHQPTSPRRRHCQSGGLNIRFACPRDRRLPSAGIASERPDRRSFVRSAEAHRSPIWLRVRVGPAPARCGSKPGRRVGRSGSIDLPGSASAARRRPGHRRHERLGPGRDRVTRLDLLPGRRPFLPQPRVADERPTASTHSSAVVARNPVSPSRTISRCDADRVGHHRQPRRLVLQDLQPALSPAPEVVGNPAYADVPGRKLARLGLLVPGHRHDRQRKRLGKSVADHAELQIRDRLRPLAPRSVAIARGPGACSTSRSRPARPGLATSCRATG